MKNTEISFDTIEKAVQGEEASLRRITAYFKYYMESLSIQPVVLEDGKRKYQVDTDMYLQLENALLEAIPKFRMYHSK